MNRIKKHTLFSVLAVLCMLVLMIPMMSLNTSADAVKGSSKDNPVIAKNYHELKEALENTDPDVVYVSFRGTNSSYTLDIGTNNYDTEGIKITTEKQLRIESKKSPYFSGPAQTLIEITGSGSLYLRGTIAYQYTGDEERAVSNVVAVTGENAVFEMQNGSLLGELYLINNRVQTIRGLYANAGKCIIGSGAYIKGDINEGDKVFLRTEDLDRKNEYCYNGSATFEGTATAVITGGEFYPTYHADITTEVSFICGLRVNGDDVNLSITGGRFSGIYSEKLPLSEFIPAGSIYYDCYTSGVLDAAVRKSPVRTSNQRSDKELGMWVYDIDWNTIEVENLAGQVSFINQTPQMPVGKTTTHLTGYVGETNYFHFEGGISKDLANKGFEVKTAYKIGDEDTLIRVGSFDVDYEQAGTLYVIEYLYVQKNGVTYYTATNTYIIDVREKTPIEPIILNVEIPKAGDTFTPIVTTTTEHIEVRTANWYANKNSAAKLDGTTVQEGQECFIKVELRVDDAAYCIPEGASIRINGSQSNGFYLKGNGIDFCEAGRTFTIDKMIREVKTNIPAPSVGQTPATTGVLQTEGVEAKLTWYKSQIFRNNFEEMDYEIEDGRKAYEKFIAGYDYRCEIELTAATGYDFAGNVTLNDENAYTVKITSDRDSASFRTSYYASYVSILDLDMEIPTPGKTVAGMTPPTVSSPAGSCTAKVQSWQRMNADGEYYIVAGNYQFAGNNRYKVEILLSVVGQSCFLSGNMTVNINGVMAEINTCTAASCLLTLEYELPAENYVDIIDFFEPEAGETASEKTFSTSFEFNDSKLGLIITEEKGAGTAISWRTGDNMHFDGVFAEGETYTAVFTFVPRDYNGNYIPFSMMPDSFRNNTTVTYHGTVPNNVEFGSADYHGVNVAAITVEKTFTIPVTVPVVFSANTEWSVFGSAQVDTTAMAAGSPDFAAALEAGEVTYQWYRNGKEIEGAVNSIYQMTTDDSGKAPNLKDLYVKVTYKSGDRYIPIKSDPYCVVPAEFGNLCKFEKVVIDGVEYEEIPVDLTLAAYAEHTMDVYWSVPAALIDAYPEDCDFFDGKAESGWFAENSVRYNTEKDYEITPTVLGTDERGLYRYSVTFSGKDKGRFDLDIIFELKQINGAPYTDGTKNSIEYSASVKFEAWEVKPFTDTLIDGVSYGLNPTVTTSIKADTAHAVTFQWEIPEIAKQAGYKIAEIVYAEYDYLTGEMIETVLPMEDTENGWQYRIIEHTVGVNMSAGLSYIGAVRMSIETPDGSIVDVTDEIVIVNFAEMGVRVSGTVKSGEPESAPVVVKILDGETILFSTVALGCETNFKIKGVEPAGDYTLQISKIGHEVYEQNITVDSSNINIGTIILEQFENLYVIAGDITSEDGDAEPITAALYQGSTLMTSETLTGLDVSYSFTGLPAGTYTLKITKPGYEVYEQSIEITDSDVMHDAELIRHITKFSISGTITSEDDESGIISVVLYDGSSIVAETTAAGTSASYSFADILPGTYTLKISKTGYEEYTAVLTVSDAALTADAVLSKAVIVKYSVSGTITSADDETSDITVALISEGTVVVETSVTGTSASYNLTDLLPGIYTLKVTKTGYEAYTKDITITGTDVTENVTLTKISSGGGVATISGTVTSYGTGTTTVKLLNTDESATSHPDCTGDTTSFTYTFMDVPEGDYIIRVSKPNHVTRDYKVHVG